MLSRSVTFNDIVITNLVLLTAIPAHCDITKGKQVYKRFLILFYCSGRDSVVQKVAANGNKRSGA